MEELNKNQIVLLVLLVSFVTSIATGIVTVTLMDQAPPVVTQTVNRIVERTVEKVVPNQTQVSTVVKEVPVIVTEEELILKIINNASSGVVRVTGSIDGNQETFSGSGFFVSPAGVLVVGGGSAISATGTYRAILPNGQSRTLTRLVIDPIVAEASSELAFFKLDFSTDSTGDKDNKWPALIFSKSLPSIGQTVVALGYSDRSDLNVSVGIVSSLLSSGASSTPLIVTKAVGPDNYGGPILNIKGEVVGMSKGLGVALPAETIVESLAKIK